MLCTGHAGLRDRLTRWALILDVLILGFSTWLVALAFVAPHINFTLTPFCLDPQLWSGLLAVFVFFLSVLQAKVDWKGRAAAHERSLATYAEVKREAGYLLASGQDLDDHACRRLFARYDMASAVSVGIPERDFLGQKRSHKAKLELSRHLDQFPFASIIFTRIRFWIRDNLRMDRGNDAKS
jgi:hypothetical protein